MANSRWRSLNPFMALVATKLGVSFPHFKCRSAHVSWPCQTYCKLLHMPRARLSGLFILARHFVFICHQRPACPSFVSCVRCRASFL